MLIIIFYSVGTIYSFGTSIWIMEPGHGVIVLPELRATGYLPPGLIVFGERLVTLRIPCSHNALTVPRLHPCVCVYI